MLSGQKQNRENVLRLEQTCRTQVVTCTPPLEYLFILPERRVFTRYLLHAGNIVCTGSLHFSSRYVKADLRLREDINPLKNSHILDANHRFALPSLVQEKVRLLKFVCDFGSGGTEGQIFNLVKGLDPTHFKLAFAALNKTGPFVEEYAQLGTAIQEFPIASFFSPRTCMQMLRFVKHLRSNRIEIMHAYNFYSLVFAIPAAKLAGVPVIIASIRDRGERSPGTDACEAEPAQGCR